MTSPTAFNTLSNAYAAAIELASPRTAKPIPALSPKTAINTARPLPLRLVTNPSSQTPVFPSQRLQTPGPFTVVYPDTPTTFSSSHTPLTAHPGLKLTTPTFTFTPPQSAHPSDASSSRARDRDHDFRLPAALAPPPLPSSPRTPRRRATTGSSGQYLAPYSHPRSLRSILRNSPLPPRSATSPVSRTGTGGRLAEKAGKRVGYDDPLTQTIVTERYVKSHIELLAEEGGSPSSATEGERDVGMLDLALADGGETRDGGQTPGPFEEMRRRMAGLGGEADGGVRKRKRREKKRQWIWTIGVGEEEAEEGRGETPVTPWERREGAREGEGMGELLMPRVYVPATSGGEEMEGVEVERPRPGSSHSI